MHRHYPIFAAPSRPATSVRPTGARRRVDLAVIAGLFGLMLSLAAMPALAEGTGSAAGSELLVVPVPAGAGVATDDVATDAGSSNKPLHLGATRQSGHKRHSEMSLLGQSSTERMAAFGPERSFGPYLELQSVVQGLKHDKLDVFGPYGSVVLGTWIRPGIGVEVFADTPFSYGEDNGFEAGVSEAYGAALRLRSPSNDGLYGYVVIGYVDFSVYQEPKSGGFEIEERFAGARLSVGVMQRLRILPAMLVTAEYRNLYSDEPIRVDGLSLGLRLDVR